MQLFVSPPYEQYKAGVDARRRGAPPRVREAPGVTDKLLLIILNTNHDSNPNNHVVVIIVVIGDRRTFVQLCGTLRIRHQAGPLAAQHSNT